MSVSPLFRIMQRKGTGISADKKLETDIRKLKLFFLPFSDFGMFFIQLCEHCWNVLGALCLPGCSMTINLAI